MGAFKEFRKVYVERGYAGIDNDSYAQREAVAGVFRAFRDGDYRVVNELTSHLGRLTPVDAVGAAKTQPAGGIVDVPGLSGLTMRYVKFAGDMLQAFGPGLFPKYATGEQVLPQSTGPRPADGPNIVEIGVGFGGQAAVLTRLFDVKSYTLIDLPEVLLLARRYLEAVGAPLDRIRFVNAVPEDGFAKTALPTGPDLVISTFAYTEVNLPNRAVYFDKIVRGAKRGFIADNSGWTGDGSVVSHAGRCPHNSSWPARILAACSSSQRTSCGGTTTRTPRSCSSGRTTGTRSKLSTLHARKQCAS